MKSNPGKPNTLALRSWQLIGVIAAIVIITFIVFSPASKNGFINWDDNGYVFENPNLNKPLPEAASYFFGPHYFIGNYIPLTMMVYTLEFQAVGLKPAFFHNINLLIHLLNVVLVFCFIYQLSGKRPIPAIIVSLLFGIHPMHVESVVWVSELKDVLFSFFFLSGLLVYYAHLTHKAEKKITWYLAAAFLLFLLSVLSKPAAVVFPLALLLIDLYTQRRANAWLWLEKLPFFIVSLIFGIVNIKAQQADHLIHDYFPFTQRLLFASYSLLTYIMKLFFPVNLSIFYPYPTATNGDLPAEYYIAPFIVLLLIYGIYRFRQSRLLLFGFLFFLVNIVLVLQLITAGEASMAERYTYIPYIGLLFIIGMGFDKLYQKQLPKLSSFRMPAIVALAAFALICAGVSQSRIKVWKSDDTIATDLLEKYPNDRLALNNKGFILYSMGNYTDAIKLFTRAVQLKPDYTMAYINLIDAYSRINDIENARIIADTALAHVHGNYNLLNRAGIVLTQAKRYPEAIKLFTEATHINPQNVSSYLYLAESYYVLKDYDNAMKTTDAALKYNPQNHVLLNNKGYMLFMQKRYSDAIPYYEACLRIKPDYANAIYNMKDCRRILDSLSVNK